MSRCWAVSLHRLKSLHRIPESSFNNQNQRRMAMIPRILNVDNGPGANGLRGGIKSYSPKTTTGPWLDTYGGPMGYKRGFTTSDFQTEAQHAQLGVARKPTGEFGAGIAVPESRDARGNDLKAVGTENWQSNTKATHPNFGVIRKVE